MNKFSVLVVLENLIPLVKISGNLVLHRVFGPSFFFEQDSGILSFNYCKGQHYYREFTNW